MRQGGFVAYYRVSTSKQGQSGLGLEAQKAAVAQYMSTKAFSIVVEEFTEVETGKGTNALEKRPQLRAALAACKKYGATLIIAKLDRLARNVHFVSGLLETGVDFIAADMPQANKVMIQMHSVMAEWERDQISSRTKAALAAAKARGVALGVKGRENLKQNIAERKEKSNEFAQRLIGILISFKAAGLSQRKMVDQLNQIGLPAPKGGAWSLIQLQRVIKQSGLVEALPKELSVS